MPSKRRIELETRLRYGHRRVNQRGLVLLKNFEGLSLKAYLCPAGVLTIGYGHTDNVSVGQEITLAQAEALLLHDLEVFERDVAARVQVPLNDNQFSALICFTFNIGIMAFCRSSLLRKLNKGFYQEIPAELRRWRYAAGVEMKGLIKRRDAEIALWQSL